MTVGGQTPPRTTPPGHNPLLSAVGLNPAGFF